jgi:DNA polymerase I-like protein with 3'-5' exonuclease and polymerase domains
MLLEAPYEVINHVPMTTYVGVNGAKCHLVHTKTEWDAFFELLMKQDKVAFDTETTGFEYYLDKHIIGFSFGWGIENFYIASRHEASSCSGQQAPQIPFEYMLEDLRKYFSQKEVTTIYFNAKFDKHFLLKEGIRDITRTRDASLFWHLYDENAPGKLKVISSGYKDIMGQWHAGVVHPQAAAKEKLIDKWRGDEARSRRREFSAAVVALADEYKTQLRNQGKKSRELKKLAKEHLLKTHKYADSRKKSVHYGFIPIEMMAEYAGLDTYMTWEVFHYCVDNITWNEKLIALVEQEHELTEALIDIESTGALIDREYLIQTGKALEEEIAVLYDKVLSSFDLTNPNSSAQLVKALLSKGIFLTERTEASKGCLECANGSCQRHFKTDAKVLNKLAKDHPEVATLLEYRAKTKIKGTYVDSILAKLTKDDILHCNFRQNVSTGRMASSDPNLQNIPRKDDSIRRAFIKDDEYTFIFADYSQIEVRMTAHYSEDPVLLRAYEEGRDMHLSTMCVMFKYDYEYASSIYNSEDASDPMYRKIKELRDVAKVLNFACIYGTSGRGLSDQVPRPTAMEGYSKERWIKECESFLDAYLYGYLGVKKLMNRCAREAKLYGVLTNSFGRIRHLPHANAVRITGDGEFRWMEKRAKRQSTNALIQGECADLFKSAVIRVWGLLKGHRSKVVNLVHDEIQVYLHKDEFYLLPKIKEAMEDFDYKVPIIADFEYSTTNWADKKKLS